MSRAAARLRPLAALLACAAAITSVWIRLPPWNSLTHALSVGAPELSPWILMVAVLAGAPAVADARRSWIARGTLLAAAVAIGVSATVLGSMHDTATTFDAAMARALGPDYLATVPASVRDRLRPTPVQISEMFRFSDRNGAAVIVDRHLPIATLDGVTITADVYHQSGRGLRPTILQYYGGAWRAGVPQDNEAISRTLAADGFVVVAADYRHAPAWRWPAQRADVAAAMAWIATDGSAYGADRSRLVLLGRSAGAQLALVVGLTATSPPVAGIVGLYSPVDLTEGYRHPPAPDILGARSLESAFLGGTPDDQADAYRDASPITYADQPHPPVLLIHGARDAVVTTRFQERLELHLRQSGVAVHLEIPWAGHAFDAVPFGPSGQLALYYEERFIAWATSRAATDRRSVRQGFSHGTADGAHRVND